MDLLKAVWAYRGFILSAIRNDFKTRFAQSKLGVLWMIIHPLMQVLIFATILSEVLSAKLPGIDNKYGYALYLMAGTLFWTLFAESVSRSVNLFIENGNLMKKVAFPRICLPFIAAGSLAINNLLLLAAIFLVFAVLGHYPSAAIAWLPALMLLTLGLSMSIGLLLGVFNVFMRDIGQVVPVILQALFWLTPIVYSVEILPADVRDLFKLNPLFPLVTAYHDVLLYGRAPDWMTLLPLITATLVLGVMSLVVFRRASPEMVDAL
jgi:lipopolysaccharide transport system permease protein